MRSARQPEGINGVWITYEGERWFAGGQPMALGEARFRQIGTYHGFPVYQRDDDASRIYIPAADGLVTPFTAKR